MQKDKNQYSENAFYLDQKDELNSFRERFFEKENEVYFDGNSLGRLPKNTLNELSNTITNDWGSNLIRSWEDQWIDLPQKVASKIAELVNVSPDEICAADNTSLNLYKLAFAALEFQKNRKVVITDQGNFPTDQYILEGLCQTAFPNHTLLKLKSSNEFGLSLKEIEESINSEVALICLSHVMYKSGYVYDMKRINELAEKSGVLVLWDLSHSVGAIPLNLKAMGCKMAVGCSYKFLNSGPGASAFLYVEKALIEKLHNPIQGWFGHQKPFNFDKDYAEKKGIGKFATGTPNILSMVGITPGVEIILEAGMENLRAKSLSLSNFLIELFDAFLVEKGFNLISPRKNEERGSHVTLSHENAELYMDKLLRPELNQKVYIPDFRPPNFIRIGIAPLYNSHYEILGIVKRLMEIHDQIE